MTRMRKTLRHRGSCPKGCSKDDSDSFHPSILYCDEEDAKPEQAKAPVKESTTKAKDSSSDSDSSSSDSDDEEDAKPEPAKAAAAPAKDGSDSDSSSSSSDSDSDDEEEAAKPAKAVETAKAKDSSSDSDSSDSDSDDEMVVNNKRKREDDDGASTPAAKKANVSSTEGCVVRVSGMPYETTEQGVKDFFKGLEIVGIDMPTWPDSGRSKGYANLTFANSADATKCIEMNGATMGSRWLKIEAHNGRTPFKPGNPGEKPEGCTRVFIGNLSYDIDEETLRNTLKDCGEITRLKWGEDRDTGDFKGYAHVDFANSDDTEKAVALNGEMVLGAVKVAMHKAMAVPHAPARAVVVVLSNQ